MDPFRPIGQNSGESGQFVINTGRPQYCLSQPDCEPKLGLMKHHTRSMLQLSRSFWLGLLFLILADGLICVAADPPPVDAPRASDPRLEVVRFAAAPNIVHPISLDFDHRGRLLVIESHTHFRPAQYQGPAHDRIRVLEDTDGDGQADRFTTFFEGTTFTMDLAVHPDGSVYVATRSEILRLRDTDNDGVSDHRQQVVKLETTGNYPHNGLSGLSFDFQGNLIFGLGENLGASYKLIGQDGTTIADEGEGGNIFWCTAQGDKLRRVATGFWNPFGTTIDVYGRMWAVDNDPDAMPPCRLLHVVEGGDYGYQFRYGRSGRHPFQAWNGQLPGTLPMASGTGEAPCEVLSYESDGLPREYLGDLLVTSWADHRVERYTLKPRGASYEAERKPFVQGGSEFRPVGLAVAPDGSLFVSDWVRRDYNLHGQGSIWHIRQRKSPKVSRPEKPELAIDSLHRPLREAAARKLALEPAGQDQLRKQLGNPEVRIRAAALEALANASEAHDELRLLADRDPVVALRAHAVELSVARSKNLSHWLDPSQPAAVRLAAMPSLGSARLLNAGPPTRFLSEEDPFLRSAAIQQLAGLSHLPVNMPRAGLPSAEPDPRQRVGLLLIDRAAGRSSVPVVSHWLDDPDEDVRFLAVKWIADRRLTELRSQVMAALGKPDLNVRMYQAYATALSRIDGQDGSESKMADYFAGLLADEKTPAARRVAALRLVPATHKKLTIDLLRRLLADPDPALRLEVVRTLAEHPDLRRFDLLNEMVRDEKFSQTARAEALVGLAVRVPPPIDLFLELAQSNTNLLFRNEALRGLTGETLTPDQRNKLKELAQQQSPVGTLAARALGEPLTQDRAPPTDTVAWLKRLEGPADPDAGRRVFFHPKLAGCFRCHRVEGHGQEIGPDLSMVGRTERRHILESILQPSNLVPPHYQVWQLELNDGRTLAGMLIRTNLDEYTYADNKGSLFKVRTVDIADSIPARTSIMPAEMVDRLTDQELRDLLAYLQKQR
jgi:putative membrane-bound dehydrogenase-like protein